MANQSKIRLGRKAGPCFYAGERRPCGIKRANPQLTTLIANYAGQQWAATANGVANFIFQVASLISPLIAGAAIDLTGNFGMVWWILAAGPLAGIGFILLVCEPLPQKLAA